jgi:hypothetical protein
VPSPTASTSSITTNPLFGGMLTRSTHTFKPSTGCKVRTTEEPSSSRGWATFARAVPVLQHSSHEKKRRETYKRLTCWPSSSTTSTAPPTMFSTTSGTSTKRRETYKRLTCWPSSSTTSTAPPTMFSTTSGASTVRSLLVRRSEDGGGWRTGTTMRMMHMLPEFTTEARRR